MSQFKSQTQEEDEGRWVVVIRMCGAFCHILKVSYNSKGLYSWCVCCTMYVQRINHNNKMRWEGGMYAFLVLGPGITRILGCS